MKKIINRGFTLIEMIVSIALLLILAGGILRVFIASQVLHSKAVDLDHAILKSTEIIEEFKNTDSIYESSFKYYFNEDWERQTDQSSPACFAVYGNIAPLKSGNSALFHIDIRIVRVLPYPFEKDGETEIYKLSSILENKSYWGGQE